MILRHTLSAAGLAGGLGLRCFTATTARLGKASKVSRELAALRSLSTDDDHRHARTWVDSFTLEDVPKEELDVSYARSSGPGGQHVNKTNSKAVVRIDIHKAKWLPPFVLPALQKTVSFTASRRPTAGRSVIATHPLPLQVFRTIRGRRSRSPSSGAPSPPFRPIIRDLRPAPPRPNWRQLTLAILPCAEPAIPKPDITLRPAEFGPGAVQPSLDHRVRRP